MANCYFQTNSEGLVSDLVIWELREKSGDDTKCPNEDHSFVPYRFSPQYI